ncbi:MAG: beta-galactosidase trimerization domain-containing protein [Clostridia bacterium]|nr:beta-galactosidase trimerization domain-containing protein [Clostridia bacterium]
MFKKRQVHLDFHTNEHLPVGKDFSKEQFQACLKAGHVNSITVFSKCHHGWSYHPTEVNEMHPGLDFDLLGAQLEACKEIGVNAPVYISAGYDEKEYLRHPEWRWRWSFSDAEAEEYRQEVHFHALCFNTGYLDLLCAQIEEVMVKYNPCGIFLDIIAPRVCCCESCVRDMRAQGYDVNNEDDLWAFGQVVYNKYLERTNAAVRKHSATATVFHNGGHVPKGDYRYINANTHLELESLPTGGWGYDHFPLSAAYVRTLEDTDFLGMTGKFHHSWGEFGGYKHPNALIYEAALSVANGAGCSVGDQMHPLSALNEATYNLIGKAYSHVEEREPWLEGAVNLADIAVLSAEAVTGDRSVKSDVGANRMLLENHLLYNFVDEMADFSQYKLLVLPDASIVNDETIAKIKAFAENGGKVIATGESIIKDNRFTIDFGAEYIGKNEFNPTYLVPEFDTVNGRTEYVMRCDFNKFTANKGRVIAYMQNPYFNRTLEHYCSHMHAPNNPEESFAGAVISGNIAYIGWDIFTAYATYGHLCFKELFTYAVNELLGDEATVMADMPDRGVVTYTHQEKENRNILHLLFAHTTVRGINTEIIEDTVPLYNVRCSVKCDKKPTKITLVPENESLDFTLAEGRAEFTVPKVDIHGMVEIAYDN